MFTKLFHGRQADSYKFFHRQNILSLIIRTSDVLPSSASDFRCSASWNQCLKVSCTLRDIVWSSRFRTTTSSWSVPVFFKVSIPRYHEETPLPHRPARKVSQSLRKCRLHYPSFPNALRYGVREWRAPYVNMWMCSFFVRLKQNVSSLSDSSNQTLPSSVWPSTSSLCQPSILVYQLLLATSTSLTNQPPRYHAAAVAKPVHTESFLTHSVLKVECFSQKPAMFMNLRLQ